jgi:hypothetical protein
VQQFVFKSKSLEYKEIIVNIKKHNSSQDSISMKRLINPNKISFITNINVIKYIIIIKKILNDDDDDE